MKIADICPLFFNVLKNKFKQDVDYIQCFYSTDKVLLQAFGDDNTFVLKNLTTNTQEAINFLSYSYNDHNAVKHYTLTDIEDGIYSVVIGGKESEPFEFTSNSNLLESTTLVKFSHKDNGSIFDNIFWMGEEQQIFEFRVESGINYKSAKVDNEQYRNQFQEIIELYAVPYDSYELIIGNSSGLPYWYMQFLNRILCLSMVQINGSYYVRSGKSEVETSLVSEDGQLFNMSILLENVKNSVNGIGGKQEIGSVTFPSIVIENPKENDVLIYRESESAFKNEGSI